MKYRHLILTFALSFVFFGLSAHAQVGGADIILNTSPLNPAPGVNVTAKLDSFATDLNKANITWSLGGVEKMAGVGKKTFSFTMSAAGVNTVLEARIETYDGQNAVKRTILTSAGVDMLWQAVDSYAPPFYRGKTMVPEEGSFKVVAMPNINTLAGKINPLNLSYEWRKDGSAEPGASGWGKNYFVFQNSYLDRDNTVEVSASGVLGGGNADGSITLNTATPQIIFYKYDPALGVKYQNAILNGERINTNGETLVAEPYFVTPKNLNSDVLELVWTINGSPVSTDGPKNILSIRPDSGKSGTAVLKLAINNVRALFGSIEKEINVNF